MSDSKPLNEWVKDWEALQRQYLGAWSDMLQKMPGAAQPAPAFSTPFGAMPAGMFGAAFGAMPPGMSGGAFGAPPAPAAGWPEGFEQWSRMFGAKGAAGGAGDTVERMLEGGKAYVGMLKSMLGGLGSDAMGAAGGNPAQAWLDAMRGGMGAMPGLSMPGMDAMSANPFLQAIRDIAGQGAKGFGDLPSSFAPFLEQFREQNLSWLRMPAFGLGREHQEHYQRSALAFIGYQNALRGYNALLLKASQRGLELMEGKLAEHSEPGRTIDSPRALYDLWVDAAEEAYAEIALSDEFGKAYGELANAQMRLRAQIQAEVERVGTDLGMPTRSELDSVHQRLHDLRREFRDSQRGSGAIADLEAEVEVLRTEVARLNSALEALRLDANAAPAKDKAAPSKAKSPAADATVRAGKARSKAKKASAKRVGAKAARAAAEAVPAAPIVPVDAKRKPARAGKRASAASARPRSVQRKTKDRRAQRRARAKIALVEQDSAPAARPTSFGDAIDAMRKRVDRSTKPGRLKSVAAQFVGSYKSASSRKRSGKRRSSK
ncbi:MAG: class III poly(R)-hydroxyalkanoic acid synthase subunit PhaE [Rudaea sp.]